MLPELSTQIEAMKPNLAEVARPPSPENPEVPVPAMVVMMPPTVNF